MTGLKRLAASGGVALLLLALTGGAGVLMLRASGSSAPPAAHGGHAHGEGHKHDEEGVVTLSDAKVAAAAIELEKAGPATLRESLRLNGVIQPNQEAMAQVTPRFPGIVRSVRKRLGDMVAAGDVLATVESNQSLTVYELRAPIAGTIIERNAALGEYVSEQKPAFVVAELSTVWIDLSVYRRDFSRVRLGDAVVIDADDGGPPVETTISYVSPIGASDTQSAVARAVVPDGGRLRPGLFVTARLLLGAKPVALAVKLSALQTLDGKTVVFVRDGDKFAAREVELGARDDRMVEVLFGLLPDDVYAAKNSFVVKAELGKGSATHEH
ncbi:MAG: efflux RND transporter periplasmic adaptor subunit [Rhodospirillales bacterium]|nr:MAG: efflux RND transporter periplasmic adaptor subunit [Rhodospirillales bacterium]